MPPPFPAENPFAKFVKEKKEDTKVTEIPNPFLNFVPPVSDEPNPFKIYLEKQEKEREEAAKKGNDVPAKPAQEE